jgi:hypothetical protein
MKYIILFLFSALLFNCNNSPTKEMSAQDIIDTSIEVMGGEQLDSSYIEFAFRDKYYTAYRHKGIYQLSREFVDSINSAAIAIKDELSNNGFERIANKKIVTVPDSMATKYSASVNSVHYFSVLPYGLNDAAVIKNRIDDVTINDKNYYTIQVTFQQEGGGEDFEDVFLYWIHKDSFRLDYLAYSYNEDDGKGVRFREAYNERTINGIRFVDYNNYRPKSALVKLQELPKLFQSGELDLLSKIELKNIKVN